MIFRINELKGRRADRGSRVTTEDIAVATGINRKTIDNLIAGNLSEVRMDYIDALCAYFGVGVDELIEPEPITLPLALNLRPDRHGARVGQRTKNDAAPAPTENQSRPPFTPTKAEYLGPATEAGIIATPPGTASPYRGKAALIPPVANSSGGTPGARDVAREAALEERRKALLEQAAGRG